MAYADLLGFLITSQNVIDFDDIEPIIGRGAVSRVFRGIYHSKGGWRQSRKVKWFDRWDKGEDPIVKVCLVAQL